MVNFILVVLSMALCFSALSNSADSKLSYDRNMPSVLLDRAYRHTFSESITLTHFEIGLDKDQKCLKTLTVEKQGNDNSDNNGEQETTQVQMAKSECLSFYVQEELRKQFTNCHKDSLELRNSVSKSEANSDIISIDMDEECLCVQHRETLKSGGLRSWLNPGNLIIGSAYVEITEEKACTLEQALFFFGEQQKESATAAYRRGQSASRD